ncbi:rRNA primary transcript metabolism protein [Rhizophlyctis rosea]|nr:rRNA primary transcript metabolism protein [Rhizophlyctis rosea]
MPARTLSLSVAGDQKPASAEAVTRLLRTAGADPAEKLAFARQTWESRSLYIPGKADLLFDWVSNALLKSIPKGDLKYTDSMACVIEETLFLSASYWSFLHDLCKSFASKKSSRLAHEGILTFLSLTSKTPIMPSFLAVPSKLIDLASNDFAASSTKQWASLLQVVNDCWTVLTTELSEILRPTLEQHVSISLKCMEALIHLLRLEEGSGVLEAFVPFATNVLSVLKKTQEQYPNQKKIFTHTISKCLPLFITARHLLKTSTPASSSRIPLLEIIEGLIYQGLFHREHLAEFDAVLVQLNAQKSTSDKDKDMVGSYPKQLFQKLGEMVEAAGGVADVFVVFSSFPLLFTHFIQSRTSTQRSTPMNTTFSAEFTFYRQLHDLVHRRIQHILSRAEGKIKAQNAKDLELLFSVETQLLDVVRVHNVYRATNDEVSKRMVAFFEEVAGEVVEVAGRVSAKHHGIFFRLWDILLALDYGVVQARMDELWSFILMPHRSALPNAVQFICALFDTYTKSRQLHVFVGSTLSAMKRMGITDLEGCTVLSAECLQRLGTCVGQLLPAQAIEVLREIKDEILRLNVFASSEPTDDESATPRKKKRKTESNGDVSSSISSTNSHPSPSPSIPRGAIIPTTLLQTFLRHAHISAAQQSVFNALSDEIYNGFVLPVMHRVEVDGKKKARNVEEFARELCYPALCMVLWLCEASEDFFERWITAEWVEDVLAKWKYVGTVEPRVSLLKNKLALYYIDHVASTTVDPSSDPACTRIVGKTLENMDFASGDLDAVWDRDLRSLDGGNLVVANWCCVGDHLAAVGRVATGEGIEGVVGVFVRSLVGGVGEGGEEEGGRLCSVGSVSGQLLGSASFWEVGRVRDLFVNHIFETLQTRLSSAITPTSTSEKPLFTAFQSLFKAHSAADVAAARIALVSSISSLLTDTHPPSLTFKCKRLDIAIDLLAIFNAVPGRYLTGLEKERVGCLLVGLEALLGRWEGVKEGGKRKGKEVGCLLRGVVVCRILGRRVLEGSERGVLLYSPDLLQWYLNSFHTCTSLSSPTTTHFTTAMETETFDTISVLARKLLQRGGAKLKGASSTPAEYILSTLSILKSEVERGEWRGVSSFLGVLVGWVGRKVEKGGGGSDTASVLSAAGSVVEEVLEGAGGAGIGDVVRDVGGFLEWVEGRCLEVLEGFVGAEGMEVDREEEGGRGGDVEEVGRVFDVFKVVVMWRRIRSDDADSKAALSKLLKTAGSLVAVGVERVHDNQLAYLPLASEFTTTFAGLIRVLDRPLSCPGVRDFVRIVWHLMRSSHSLSRNTTAAPSTDPTTALSILVREATKEQYLSIVQMHLDALDGVISFGGCRSAGRDVDGDVEVEVLVRSLGVLLEASNQEVGRRSLKGYVAAIIAKVCLVVGGGRGGGGVEGLVGCLGVLRALVGDKSLPLKAADLSMILNAVVTISSPETAARIVTTPASAIELFHAIYRLLSAVVGVRKEEVVDIIPVFVGIVGDLIDCFRIREPRFFGMVRGGKDVGAGGGGTWKGDPFQVLTTHGPLPVACAENLNRLLLLMSQKSTTASSSTGTTSHTTTLTAQHVKPFSKHAPFLLSRWCGVLAGSRPVEGERRRALEEGVGSLVGLCGVHGREAVLAGVDKEIKGVVKSVVGEWSGRK